MNRFQFIRRLRHEADQNLGPELSTVLVAEVSAHLEEDIASRREFGEPADLAEANAIVAFGSPSQIVQNLAKIYLERPVHDTQLLLWGIASVFCCAVVASHVGGGLASAFVTLACFSILGFAIRSAVVGVPCLGSLRRLAFTSLVVVVVVFPLLTRNQYATDGKGFIYLPKLASAHLTVGQPVGDLRWHIDAPSGYRYQPVSYAIALESQVVPLALDAVLWTAFLWILHLVAVGVSRIVSRLRASVPEIVRSQAP